VTETAFTCPIARSKLSKTGSSSLMMRSWLNLMNSSLSRALRFFAFSKSAAACRNFSRSPSSSWTFFFRSSYSCLEISTLSPLECLFFSS